MHDGHGKLSTHPDSLLPSSFSSRFISQSSSSSSSSVSSTSSLVRSPCASLSSLLAAAAAGLRGRQDEPPAACSSGSSSPRDREGEGGGGGRGGGGGGASMEGMYPADGDFPRRNEGLAGVGPAAAAGVAPRPSAAAGYTSPLAAKPVDQMTARDIMRLLPREDQEHVMRIARQGRLCGFFSAAAAGSWVYRSLRTRGSPFPLLGGAAIGLALGYPLGITLTMAFHGRFLRRISQDLTERQRRAREQLTRDGPPAAEYYSTFPTGMQGAEQRGARPWGDDAAAEAAAQQQQPPEWGASPDFLRDTQATGAAAAGTAQRPQQPRAGPAAAGSNKGQRVDGTGKGDEILKV